MIPARILVAALFVAGPVQARIARADVPTMVAITAGSTDIGSDPAETTAAGASADYAAREQPRFRATIAVFAIGRTEVTRGQFGAFVRATGWKPDGGCASLADGPGNKWASDPARTWANPGFAQTDRHPVVCVDFADAQAYAAWLSRETGTTWRLPTSAEWEYAARAGTHTVNWWSRPADSCRWGNIGDAARARADGGEPADAAHFAPCDDGHARTAPVASYRPNAFGLYDMIGNVWEWTLDCLDPTLVGSPADGGARTSGDCGSHIDRGASWTNSPKFVRLAARHADLAGARNTVLGFRVVRERR